MGGVRNARMIKVQVCCSMGCKWCMAYAYILVCYVIPRASPSEWHKHPRMYTYAIHHYNPYYNIYITILYINWLTTHHQCLFTLTKISGSTQSRDVLS